ncbi:SEL1-like repeat protein [Kiloniella laminariae]|uniref:SEL1-like repeat protein n=1 Tax=Kiloniella laminariae TaxID=454162 RepID=UPI000370B11F|nr:SEL1-like repeat protein [Kiloniella laminariae]
MIPRLLLPLLSPVSLPLLLSAFWRLCAPIFLSGSLLLLPVAPAQAVTQQEAMQAMTEGDFATAYVFFLEHAEAGNPAAQYLVGYMMERGAGTEQNLEQAIVWYRKAAKQGNPDAQQQLARLGVAEQPASPGLTPEQALFERTLELARAGDMKAQTAVGYMYQSGSATAQDNAAALIWFHKAAAQGDRLAMVGLAVLYYDTDNAFSDTTKAFEWYKKAADLDYEPAFIQVGLLYMIGDGTKQDHGKARIWLEKAAELGDKNAQFYLGDLFLQSQGGLADFFKARRWYQAAAEQGQADAQLRLAIIYHDGLGTERDDKTALEWMKRSAEQQYHPALFMLAQFYEEGQVVSLDRQEALRLYRQAEALGNLKATEAIDRLESRIAQEFGGKAGSKAPSKAGETPDTADAPDAPDTPDPGAETAEKNLGFFDALKQAVAAQKRGNSQDQNALQKLFGSTEESPEEEQNPAPHDARSFAKIKQVAEEGDLESQYEVSLIYFQGAGPQVPPDSSEGMNWLQLAAQRGHPAAQLALAKEYLAQASKEADPDESSALNRDAYIWARLAGNNGLAEGEEISKAAAALLSSRDLQRAERAVANWEMPS